MPPAYEVLLLNTAIPQIQAAQSGDTYVVPRDIAINATAIISANSATDALRITQTGAGNAILVEDSANPDSTPFVVTAAGDVGIGTSSPSTKLDVVGAIKATAAGASLIAVEGGAQNFALIQMQATSSGGKNWSLVSNATSSPLGAAGSLSFRDSSAGVTYMTLDSSGRLLVGVTSNTGGANLEVISNGVSAFTARSTSSGASTTVKAVRSVSSDAADFANAQYDALSHGWILSNGSQAMTLDASGRLLIGGTSSPASSNIRLLAQSPNASSDGGAQFAYNGGGGGGGAIFSATGSGLVFFGYTGVVGSETYTERARITSGGYFKAQGTSSYISSTGDYHEFVATLATTSMLRVENKNNTSGNSVLATFLGSNCSDTSSYHYSAITGGTDKLYIYGNGNVVNVNNSYGTLSDAKMKIDIVDAGSQWSDIKAIRFRKFKMKDDPTGLVQLGVVAQELEQTSPGLVDESPDRDADGNDLGTTTKSVKTSVLLMKAAVALQEAMARIETLEAEVAALKGA